MPQNAVQAGRRAEIERVCRENSLPLTAQRRIVLLTLPRLNHPTVDEVWGEVRKSMPEVSRTTVYRILETCAELRIIRKVCHAGAVTRYEEKTTRHHHLLCIRCQKMADLKDPGLDRIRLPGEGSGFHIEDYSIEFRGLCAQCAAKPVSQQRKRSK